MIASNVFAIAKVYDARALTAGRIQTLRLLICWLAVWTGLLTTAAMLKTTQDYSRVWFVAWGIGTGVALLAWRLGFRFALQRRIAAGKLTTGVALFGAGSVGAAFLERVARSGDRRYHIVGIFDERAAGRHADDPPPQGGIDALEALIRHGRVELVVVTLPWSDERRIVDVMARLRSLPVDIRLAPPRLGFPLSLERYSTISGVPLLDISRRPISGWQSVAKRAEDLVIGSLLLLLVLPLMLLIALAVKLDSPGPVFFRQSRYGYNNTLIRVFKFRTMRHELTDHHAETLVGPNDARVTWLGGWLRKTSLDELPQLLNVMGGDMSLVGPRPHALRAKAADRLYEDVVEEYAARHRVKPGITGWAQVNGWRGITDTEWKIRQRVAHDQYYIENWSVLFDLKILIMTIVAVIDTSNAH